MPTLDVVYAPMDSPLGRLFLARSRQGLLRLAWRTQLEDFQRDLEKKFGVTPELSDADLADCRRQLQDYFEGHLRSFSLPYDWTGLSAFRRRVLQATSRIPFGKVVTYGDIAESLGDRKAVRAVGQALGHNPLPILIPCHRVVGRSSIGGFSGGLDFKRRLFELEGIRLQGAEGQRRLF